MRKPQYCLRCNLRLTARTAKKRTVGQKVYWPYCKKCEEFRDFYYYWRNKSKAESRKRIKWYQRRIAWIKEIHNIE